MILPHLIAGGDRDHKIINPIPKEKPVLPDKIIPGVTGNFGAVYENFRKGHLHCPGTSLASFGKVRYLKNHFSREQLLSG